MKKESAETTRYKFKGALNRADRAVTTIASPKYSDPGEDPPYIPISFRGLNSGVLARAADHL